MINKTFNEYINSISIINYYEFMEYIKFFNIDYKTEIKILSRFIDKTRKIGFFF